MRPFGYARPETLPAVLTALREPGSAAVAGGTEMLNWIKEGIAAPDRLVDITGLPLAGVERTPAGLRIGGLTRMSDVAADPFVADEYPVLAESLLLAASAQLRNMATTGGNLMQRTRCPYFRADTELPCNQRRPGAGCAALDGDHSTHAILEWTDDCVATHPSDLAVALVALDAELEITSVESTRTLGVGELFLLPTADARHRHVALEPGELVTAITVAGPAPRSSYLKVRERVSYEFATCSAAAAVELDAGGRIGAARLALGAVAHRPYRMVAAQDALSGVDPSDTAALRSAVDRDLARARPLAGNAYKVELAARTAVRVVQMAAGVRR